eukprot:m.194218 g.194218  ORF g.194218 m.194218 type:complete len:164 (-) comp15201_c0_seq1:177-668(-)
MVCCIASWQSAQTNTSPTSGCSLSCWRVARNARHTVQSRASQQCLSDLDSRYWSGSSAGSATAADPAEPGDPTASSSGSFVSGGSVSMAATAVAFGGPVSGSPTGTDGRTGGRSTCTSATRRLAVLGSSPTLDGSSETEHEVTIELGIVPTTGHVDINVGDVS